MCCTFACRRTNRGVKRSREGRVIMEIAFWRRLLRISQKDSPLQICSALRCAKRAKINKHQSTANGQWAFKFMTWKLRFNYDCESTDCLWGRWINYYYIYLIIIMDRLTIIRIIGMIAVFINKILSQLLLPACQINYQRSSLLIALTWCHGVGLNGWRW